MPLLHLSVLACSLLDQLCNQWKLGLYEASHPHTRLSGEDLQSLYHIAIAQEAYHWTQADSCIYSPATAGATYVYIYMFVGLAHRISNV